MFTTANGRAVVHPCPAKSRGAMQMKDDGTTIISSIIQYIHNISFGNFTYGESPCKRDKNC
jgi:hypothetical protein